MDKDLKQVLIDKGWIEQQNGDWLTPINNSVVSPEDAQYKANRYKMLEEIRKDQQKGHGS